MMILVRSITHYRQTERDRERERERSKWREKVWTAMTAGMSVGCDTHVEEGELLEDLPARVEGGLGGEEEEHEALKKIASVVRRYAEAAHLLDPYLEKLIAPLARVACTRVERVLGMEEREEGCAAGGDEGQAQKTLRLACKVLLALCTQRGVRVTSKFFPVSARFLERVVMCLCELTEGARATHIATALDDGEGGGVWEVQYVLLVWLTSLVLVPFDVAALDSGAARDTSSSTATMSSSTAAARSDAAGDAAQMTEASSVSSKHEKDSDTVHKFSWQCAPLAARLLDVCTNVFLRESGPVRERAAAVLGQLLSRHDMRGPREIFEVRACKLLAGCSPVKTDASGSTSSNCTSGGAGVHHGSVHDGLGLVGASATAAAILKHSQKRSEGVENAKRMLVAAETIQQSSAAAKNTLLRKLAVKIAARACTSMLPPRVASWRYQRGQRSLLGDTSTSSSKTTAMETNASHRSTDAPDADTRTVSSAHDAGHTDNDECGESEAASAAALSNVVAPVEAAVEMLLCGLRDSDTIVRWSAAKGIGRVTMRLPLVLADDVVTATLELCDPLEGDGAWHGGCLALAELAQRGLLLPARLKHAIPIATSALAYDVRRGEHSVGAHVRDAGAYLCWSFARAYSPEVLSEGGGVMDLARSLVVTACYDREVNCRRAAAAALQEMIGRLGIGCGKDDLSVAHGLALLHEANYFTLGTRRSAFVAVAGAIARYREYRGAMVHHLLYAKLVHWERSLRELAAQALGALVAAEPALIVRELQGLVARATDKDLAVRHGATHAVAEILMALHTAADNGGSGADADSTRTLLREEQRNAVAGLVPRIEKARLYRGRGGEIMRSAVCRLIEAIAFSKMRLAPKTVKMLLVSLDEHLRHPTAEIQDCAVAALRQFTRTYMPSLEAEATTGTVSTLAIVADEPLVSRYASLAEANPNVAVRRGAAKAVGVLPAPLLAADIAATVDRLRNATKEESNPELRDPETRANALDALADVMETCRGMDDGACFQGLLRTALITAIEAFDDYAVDNRGDVGSWVREAAMRVSVRLVTLANATAPSLLTENVPTTLRGDTRSMATAIVACLVKQAAEKIDRVRASASAALVSILHYGVDGRGDIPGIASRELLCEAFPNSSEINWAAPSESFPRVVLLLADPVYRPYATAGILISVGAIGNSLVKSSGSILLKHLSGDDHLICAFTEAATTVLSDANHDNRIAVPALRTLDVVFAGVGGASIASLFDPSKSVAWNLLDATRAEMKGCKDVPKLSSCIDICSHLSASHGGRGGAGFSEVQEGALRQMLLALVNRYPRVRQYASDQLYLRFLQPEFADMCKDAEEAITILENTVWVNPAVDVVKSARMSLFEPLGLDPPQTKQTQKKTAEERGAGRHVVDENASYQALVNSMGY